MGATLEQHPPYINIHARTYAFTKTYTCHICTHNKKYTCKYHSTSDMFGQFTSTKFRCQHIRPSTVFDTNSCLSKTTNRRSRKQYGSVKETVTDMHYLPKKICICTHVHAYSIMPIIKSFLVTSLVYCLLTFAVFLMNLSLRSHVYLLAVSFLPIFVKQLLLSNPKSSVPLVIPTPFSGTPIWLLPSYSPLLKKFSSFTLLKSSFKELKYLSVC